MNSFKFPYSSIVFLLLLAGISFSSCKKAKFEIIDKGENLQPFKELAVDGTFDVYLTQDTNYSIRLTGAKEFVDQVEYSIDNNVLHVKMTGHNSWVHPKQNRVRVYVNSDSLHIVWANETSMIRTVNPIVSTEFGIVMNSKLQEADLELNCRTFFYWNVHPCGGKLALRGTTDELKLWNTALLQVQAKDLITRYALVENSSKGDCEILVTEKLEYSISGEGNVVLHGNPTQIIPGEVTASGKLVRVQ